MIFVKTKEFPIWVPALNCKNFPKFKEGTQVRIQGKVYTEDNEEFRKAFEAKIIWERLLDE